MKTSTRLQAMTMFALLSAAGCVFPAPPPVLSAAPFVRSPSPAAGHENGRISASAGYLFNHNGPSLPVGEGSAVFRLGARYDLAVGSRLDVTTVEGNLRLLRGEFRLGWTHGVGGYMRFKDSSVRDMTTHATTGLAFHVASDSPYQFFGALRYAYARGTGAYEPRSYVIGSIGLQTRLTSKLNLAPELHIAGDSEGTFYLLPTVVVSAQF